MFADLIALEKYNQAREQKPDISGKHGTLYVVFFYAVSNGPNEVNGLDNHAFVCVDLSKELEDFEDHQVAAIQKITISENKTEWLNVTEWFAERDLDARCEAAHSAEISSPYLTHRI